MEVNLFIHFAISWPLRKSFPADKLLNKNGQLYYTGQDSVLFQELEVKFLVMISHNVVSLVEFIWSVYIFSLLYASEPYLASEMWKKKGNSKEHLEPEH